MVNVLMRDHYRTSLAQRPLDTVELFFVELARKIPRPEFTARRRIDDDHSVWIYNLIRGEHRPVPIEAKSSQEKCGRDGCFTDNRGVCSNWFRAFYVISDTAQRRQVELVVGP